MGSGDVKDTTTLEIIVLLAVAFPSSATPVVAPTIGEEKSKVVTAVNPPAVIVVASKVAKSLPVLYANCNF